MQDIPEVVDDVSGFYHFCRRTLGVAPRNIYILAQDEDAQDVVFDPDEQEINEIELNEDNVDEREAARLNPYGSGVIKEHYCPYSKAKFNVLYNYLTEEEKRIAKKLQHPQFFGNSSTEYEKVWNHVVSESSRNSDEKTLILQFFACHGYIQHNMQQVISNEVNLETGFYRTIDVEQNVRVMA